jgi:hypothetical protein
MRTPTAFFLPVLLLLSFVPPARPQADETVHVKQFPGATLAEKLTAAQRACPAAPVPCTLAIDPSLAALPPGVMPALCPTCSLADNRTGAAPGDTLNAKSLGARGDCSADDTAPLTAAINAAWKQQRPLFIPPGCYLVTGLTLPANPCANRADEGKSFHIYGMASGNPFAEPGGTVIESTTDAPILADLPQCSAQLHTDGTEEIDHLYFRQKNPSALSPVLKLNYLYGISRVHDITVYQAGKGDGISVGFAATASFETDYILNRDNQATGLGTARVGTGLNFASSNSGGLLKIRGVSSRGFLNGYRIGNGTGTVYNTSIEDSEASTVTNGVLIDRAQKTKIDDLYLEGCDGGVGIVDNGHYTTVTNSLFFAGCSTGIDMSNPSTLGSVATNNIVFLGSVANATGIKLGSNYFAKTAEANSIAYTAGTAGACGIAISGKSPSIDVKSNLFNPNTAWTGAGASKVCNNATPVNYGEVQANGGVSHPYYAQGGISLYNSGTPLTEANVTSGVLTVPADGGTYYVFTPSRAVTVTSINAGTEPGRIVMLYLTNANATFINGARLTLANQGNFVGPGFISFFADYQAGTGSAHEMSRTSYALPTHP